MKSKYWAIIISGIMIIAFVFAGLFYVKSGLFDQETGELNDKMVYELEITSLKISIPFGSKADICPYEEWKKYRTCEKRVIAYYDECEISKDCSYADNSYYQDYEYEYYDEDFEY